jgi:transcriptional regulator with XRE-family HTH domain
MKILKQHTDQAILTEIGERLSRARLDKNLSQAQLALEAGVSKRTIERMEAGESVQITSFVRVLRALGRIEALDGIIPESDGRPMDLLRRQGKRRQRAARSEESGGDKPWSWGED